MDCDRNGRNNKNFKVKIDESKNEIYFTEKIACLEDERENHSEDVLLRTEDFLENSNKTNIEKNSDKTNTVKNSNKTNIEKNSDKQIFKETNKSLKNFSKKSNFNFLGKEIFQSLDEKYELIMKDLEKEYFEYFKEDNFEKNDLILESETKPENKEFESSKNEITNTNDLTNVLNVMNDLNDINDYLIDINDDLIDECKKAISELTLMINKI